MFHRLPSTDLWSNRLTFNIIFHTDSVLHTKLLFWGGCIEINEDCTFTHRRVHYKPLSSDQIVGVFLMKWFSSLNSSLNLSDGTSEKSKIDQNFSSCSFYVLKYIIIISKTFRKTTFFCLPHYLAPYHFNGTQRFYGESSAACAWIYNLSEVQCQTHNIPLEVRVWRCQHF